MLAVGEGEMDTEVAPVLQEYVPPPAAVSVKALPLQLDMPPLMVAVGVAIIVTDALVEFVQPLAAVTVTE